MIMMIITGMVNMDEAIYANIQPLLAMVVYFTALRNIGSFHIRWYKWAAGILISSAAQYALIYGWHKEGFVGMLACFCLFLFLILCKYRIIESLFYSSLTGFLIILTSHTIASLFLLLVGSNAAAAINVIVSCLIWGLCFTASFLLSREVGLQVRIILNAIIISRENKSPKGIQLLVVLISQFLMINTVIIAVMTVLLITICVTVNNILIRNIEDEHELELDTNLHAYNSSIKNLYDEIQLFRHDYINIFYTMHGYLSRDDFEGWKKFFNADVVPLFKPLLEYDELVRDIDKIRIPSLNALLLVKFIDVHERKIRLHLDIEEGIIGDFKNVVNINRIIGIFLDNAIEECAKKEGMGIQFNLYQDEGDVTVMIINDICGEPPELGAIFNKHVSSKGEGRGLGLYNARKLIANDSRLFLQTSVKNNEFCQKLTIAVQQEKGEGHA
jgi:two-component system sensor histidine kinase AgrC